MDFTTVLIIGIAILLIAMTLMSIYTAIGPGSEKLEDPFLNHTHGPGGHSHGFGGHSHSHGHGHSHSHEHIHSYGQKRQNVSVSSK